MIKKIICYTIICDNCSKDANKGSEHVGWTEKKFAVISALDANFIENEKKHYCNDCYTYDDNDKLFIYLNKKS